MAKGIGIAWTELAGKLNTQIDVDVIAAEKQQIYDRAIAALNKWYNIEGINATTTSLLQSLYAIGKSNVVDDIRIHR